MELSSLSLDAPTLVMANLIISASTVGLLLITRFGLGASGNRMNGWIAGEALLLAARLGFPFVWLLADFGWQLPIDKLLPPLVVIGLCWHVVGLRQSRTGSATTNWRGMGISVVLVTLVYLVCQPLAEPIRLKVFVASLAAVWLALLREAWQMRHRSWGGRGLIAVSAVVAGANITLLCLGSAPRTMLYTPGLVIDMVVVLLITSSYLLCVQEDVRRRLTDLAVTDALTGVLNRHGLMPQLEQKLSAAQRSGRPVSVVLCDLDHFKQVNDTHGHAVGDEVLQRFANKAKMHTRSSDHFGRWGGEEFLFVLPDTALADAQAIADRLRKGCNEADRRSGPGAKLPMVTMSAGVASSSYSEGTTVAQLLAKADRRLYLAKVSRNCVVARDELVLEREQGHPDSAGRGVVERLGVIGADLKD